MTKNTSGKNLFKMLFTGILMVFALPVVAQDNPEAAMKAAKKYMQEAEAALAEEDVATAEAFYRKAIAKDPSNAAARYNLGNLYYKKEITGEAVQRHGQAAAVTEDKALRHDSFHNRGNAFMKQKKYKEAVEAYKNSLRNNPQDDETRYNLALAKKMLEEEEKKGGGGQDDKEKNKNQQNKDQQDQKDQQGDQGDKKEDQEGKPDENKEGGEKDQKEPKEGEDKKDEKGKPQNQDQKEQKKEQGEQKPQQQQPRPGQLSPQQVKNLLEAMGNEEKKVQEKINAEKVKGVPAKTEKDW